MIIGKKKTLSIDLGSTKIRVCDIQRVSSELRVVYYDELDIPREIEDKNDFLKIEGRAFIKRQPSNSFYVSLPGRGILIRTLSIPKVPLKKIRDILKYEVQQQIPFPLEMVEWKYQILSEENQTFNILLTAAKKELISEFLNKMSLLGIDYAYLDTDLFAYFNSFMFSKYFKTEKCQAILDIGANSANLIIHHKEKILMRSLATAGDTITTSIVDAESIPFLEAEDKKISQGFQLPLVTTSIENLNTEVQNSIDFWRFTQKGPEVEDIYISGRSALFKNFKEFFYEKAKIPTHYFDSFSDMELNSQYSFLQPRFMEFAVLTGIALRKSRHTFINLDMLPAEIERIKEFKQNRLYIYISAIMAGLIAMTPTLFYNQDKAMLKGLLSELDMSLQQYDKYKPEVDDLKKELDGLQGKEGVVKGVIESKTIWLKRILDIGASLTSSRIYLISLSPGAGTGAAPASTPTGEGFSGGEPIDDEQRPPGDEHSDDDGSSHIEPIAPKEGLSVATENVFSLKGEVVVVDIKNAFGDFKSFVSKTKELPFISNVEINYCELNQEEEKLEFSLNIYMK